MAIHIICLKYKVKDALKGWAYTGVIPIGETGPDNNDTEDEIKRKMKSLIINKSLVFTHSLYLVLRLGSARAVGLIPIDKQLLKNNGSTYKIDVAQHLGLAHYVVAGSTFVLENIDIAIYDKDNYVSLKY
nr:hypothetical protein [Myrmica rubra rhabdo-like virus 1]